MKTVILFASAVVALFISSCRERDKHGALLDTPTSGTISISADESLMPIVEAEVNAFEGIYRDAHIRVHYTSEENAINDLLVDSARLVFVTRGLLQTESSVLENQKIVATQLQVATGAVALIVNAANADSLLDITQIRQILDGKITSWRQLDPTSTLGDISLVFDNGGSGIARFLRDSLNQGKDLPRNCYAVNTNEDVVKYVSGHKNVIGLIGVEWISDHDDSTAGRFLRSIRVVGIANGDEHFKPYQAYVATQDYPFCRNTLIISREARAGLGSGFAAFVASDKGQRIVLKAGLVPRTMPVRIVEISNNQ